ncbi:MAG: hypothetical protein QM750_19670 [Rubrivivax sp.]
MVEITGHGADEVKDGLPQPEVRHRLQWTHAFGVMLIETCADGSVWIDGRPVRDTLPHSGTGLPEQPAADSSINNTPCGGIQ